MFGRLWIILTDFPGPTIFPFSIICIPLLAVHEKSPLIGFTAYVYHNLPTLLKNISDIGNDQRRVMQWASLPSITPSIKVEDIAVNSI